jgi:uncharacterized protein GlcG (DUF336 family)
MKVLAILALGATLLPAQPRRHVLRPTAAVVDPTQLTAAEVDRIVTSAALAAEGDGLAVVVSDRIGNPLAIYRRPAATDDAVERALSLARTGAFFSSQGTPLSSRTVRAISRVNFPEGIPNQGAGALYGIENTNRGCDLGVSTIPRLLDATGTGYSRGIATVPGGLPLFRDGLTVVGGVGVFGLGSDDMNEFAATAGALAAGFFVRTPLPDPGVVYLNGFQLPYINESTPAGIRPAYEPGGMYQSEPRPGSPAPEGWLPEPRAGSALTATDVASIVQNAIDTALRTRAQIRLPLGTRTRMVISVADLDGGVLGVYRMSDSTIFSIDVAITKARNVVYFSGPNRDPRDLPGVPAGTAVTNRTIGFGAQVFFPSGIWNSQPGPFYPTYLDDVAAPCTQGHQAPNANQSGVAFFPGSSPLYRNGQLVGGLGVSGDGVEQDDYVTAAGARGYEPPARIRADQIVLRGVRLPYWFFPRNPEQ